MAKEKVTLTLDSQQLQALRDIAGARSLSAAVDGAVAAYLAKWRHHLAVDDWLAEMERDHGPVPPEAIDWAAQVVERWDSGRAAASAERRDAS